MKIKKVQINGFGRFNDFKVLFNDGVNLIYGSNESGKTTLQMFIKGIFYNLKEKKSPSDFYISPLKKYKPWNTKDYSGIAEYILENNYCYRIERDFNKNSVKIYNQFFEEISNQFEISKEKGVLFANSHLGIDESCFEKAAIIKQMDSKIKLEDRKELLSKLSNLIKSGNEDISYLKALDALKNMQKNCIGTSKTTTKPLDIINNKLTTLENLKNEILNKKAQIFDLKEKINGLNKSLELLNNKKVSLSEAKNVLKIKSELYENKKIEKALSEFLEEIIHLKNLDKNIKEKLKQLDIIKELLNDFNFKENIKINVLDISNTIKELKKVCDENEILKLNNSIKTLTDNNKKNKLLYLSSIFTLPVIIALTITLSSWIGFLLIPLTGNIIFAFNKYNKKNKYIIKLIKEKDSKESNLRETKNNILTFEQELEKIFVSVKAKNLEDFFYINSEYEKTIYQYNELKNNIEFLKSNFNVCMDRQNEMYLEFKHKFKLDFIEFDIANQILEESIKSVLNNIRTNIKDLETKIFNNYKDEWYQKIIDADIEQSKTLIENEYELLLSKASEIQLEIKEYEVELNNLYINENDLFNIEEEIFILTNKKYKLSSIDTSINIAIKLLSEANSELEYDLLPTLNNRFCHIFNKITGGKYIDIRIDESCSIKTLDVNLGNVISTCSLSSGTIDQVYLALRLAIGDFICERQEKLPVILDEVFSQYDDFRTEETMKFLFDKGFGRQVLIFTCKKREVEIASSLLDNNLNIIQL